MDKKDSQINFLVMQSDDSKVYKLMIQSENTLSYDDFLDCVQYFLLESVQELRDMVADKEGKSIQ